VRFRSDAALKLSRCLSANRRPPAGLARCDFSACRGWDILRCAADTRLSRVVLCRLSRGVFHFKPNLILIGRATN
jgi:hypothetical protein